jgi:hypothetical protein
MRKLLTEVVMSPRIAPVIPAKSLPRTRSGAEIEPS